MDKLIIANWKMNPEKKAEAIKLARVSDVKGIVVCPPFSFLSLVGKELKKAKLGAQDVFWEGGEGSYTGEISTDQLKALGVEYVIVGHSDRKKYFNETDEMRAKKVIAVLEAGLTPVLCVGESREDWDKGEERQVVERQLRAVLSQLPDKEDNKIIVTYEPVWAISTNKREVGLEGLLKKDITRVAVEMIRHINGIASSFPVEIKCIYGGSVNKENIAEILGNLEIQGVLVGGASLDVAEFKSIIKSVKNIN